MGIRVHNIQLLSNAKDTTNMEAMLDALQSLAAGDAGTSLTGKLTMDRVTPEWQQQPWQQQPAEWWGAVRHPGELATLLGGGVGRVWGSEQLAQRSFCSLEVSAGITCKVT